ncbi:hypothetical protein [Streptomyces roseus]|nr:hypothetical protein [Streptomyces roseus]
MSLPFEQSSIAAAAAAHTSRTRPILSRPADIADAGIVGGAA